MASLKVTKIEKVNFAGTEVLDVSFNIIDGEATLTQRHNFPLTISLAEVRAELTKTLSLFTLEKQQAADRAEQEAADANAAAVKEEMEGLEINN